MTPAGHLRVLSRHEYMAYRTGVPAYPGSMVCTESALGIPVEVMTGSLEALALTDELRFEVLLHSADFPVTALCLHAESLFVRELYEDFRDLILRCPEVGDYLLAPKDFCRRPNRLITAQAAVRYIRTTRAARAALSEMGK